MLRQRPAPKMLSLKVGAPVILLNNLSATLVNGLKGTVPEFSNVDPTIKFGSTVISPSKYDFDV